MKNKKRKRRIKEVKRLQIYKWRAEAVSQDSSKKDVKLVTITSSRNGNPRLERFALEILVGYYNVWS